MLHYSFHIGDYIKDTVHLSDEEDLCYRRLLDLYYTLESPLPLDVRATSRRARVAQDTAQQILDEFFTRTDEGFRHSRCDAELHAIYAKSESARTSAEKRWEKQRNANAMRTHNEGNATHNPLPITQVNPLSDSQANTDVVLLKNGKQKFKGDAEIVLAFLNEKTGRAYRPLTANLDFIAERLKEGATVADCRKVIAKKSREWAGTDMAQYLRPATLFNRTKFAQYVGELHVEQSPIGDYV